MGVRFNKKARNRAGRMDAMTYGQVAARGYIDQSISGR